MLAFKVPLRSKIVLIIFSLVFVITLSSFVFGSFYSRNHFLDTVKNDLSLMAKISGKLISNEISLLKEETRSLAEQIRLAGRNPENTARALETHIKTSRFSKAAVLDNRGGIISYGDPAFRKDEYLLSPYARQALAWETVIGTASLDPRGDLVLRVWTPLDEGRILAVVLPGLHISDIIMDFKVWETGSVFIIDAQGTFVAHRREQLVLEQRNYIESSRTDPAWKSAGDFFQTMILNGSGIGLYTFNGVERLCAYRYVEGSMDWVLGVSAPMRESPLAQFQQVLFIFSCVFLGLGVLTAFLTANSIAKPFEQLNEQNIRLEELKTKAESASDTKSQFLANMSHEMRTPLNAIIGLSELELGSTELAENTYNNVEKIYISGMTLLGIINDILDISKIESGKFILIPAEFNVPSLINDTVTLNIVRIGSKPIEFRLHIDENVPERVIGDELRVKQIFNNLLSNAFKYTREGVIDWYISADVLGDSVWLVSRIQDTGIGIQPEDISKLFSDYNQVDTGSNRKIEGTGLGLSITKSLVELMDGTISVESEYGRGSVFSIRIRQHYVNEAVIGRDVADNLTHFHFTARRRTANEKLIRAYMPYATVLVVDDVPVNLDVARGMLKPYGMTVECVTSGQKAINLIREEKVRYNAVFMDHMMPEMDGIEAVRIIRNEIGTEYAKTVPIIAFTANAIIGNDELFLQSGFQAFLSKPIDIMRLDTLINQWVRDKKLEKELFPVQASETQDRGICKVPLPAELEAAGVDSVMGLRMFGGDEDSYFQVLRSFILHTPVMLETVRNFTPERIHDYAVSVHGVKGACYGICAHTAGKKAEALEHAAKAENLDFIRDKNASFVELADKLIKDLSVFLDSAGAGQKKIVKPAPDGELLAQALEASRNYDIDGLEKIVTEMEQYAYESQADLVPWMREQLLKSEFDAIQEKLTHGGIV
ncbi:MAG: response regulator [Spirochaetales bacterium]|jgi:signal transduction histidine kinase/CheY-like chemotaxis protein|nr:response regulator [Spirochaetales bacterium]